MVSPQARRQAGFRASGPVSLSLEPTQQLRNADAESLREHFKRGQANVLLSAFHV